MEEQVQQALNETIILYCEYTQDLLKKAKHSVLNEDELRSLSDSMSALTWLKNNKNHK